MANRPTRDLYLKFNPSRVNETNDVLDCKHVFVPVIVNLFRLPTLSFQSKTKIVLFIILIDDKEGDGFFGFFSLFLFPCVGFFFEIVYLLCVPVSDIRLIILLSFAVIFFVSCVSEGHFYSMFLSYIFNSRYTGHKRSLSLSLML